MNMKRTGPPKEESFIPDGQAIPMWQGSPGLVQEIMFDLLRPDGDESDVKRVTLIAVLKNGLCRVEDEAGRHHVLEELLNIPQILRSTGAHVDITVKVKKVDRMMTEGQRWALQALISLAHMAKDPAGIRI